MMRWYLGVVLGWAALGNVSAGAAELQPAEVFVIANRRLPASREVAEHYCQRRQVPRDNLILLDLPTGEDISRADYNVQLVQPLREALKDRKDRVKVVLSVYGVPLRVGGAEPDEASKQELAKLRPRLQEIRRQLAEIDAHIAALEAEAKEDPPGALADTLQGQREQRAKLAQQEAALEQRRKWLTQAESLAAVDSELMLLWHDKYELRRWQPNPLHWQFPKDAQQKEPIVMTCRLDGPTPEIAKRLVDDALAAEMVGLSGKVYVDARGIGYDPKKDPGFGYGGYDESMREMAQLLKEVGKLEVILDNRNELFGVGSCPDCMLYCGWYSHANFIDCCRFRTGAVAWHLASSEAVSLRRKDAKYWCKNLLEKGAAATIGPVAEPYTIGFPKPAEFFGFLVTGEFTLVETYARTTLFTSWMGTLIGDPLYRPFRVKPALKLSEVPASPRGGVPAYGLQRKMQMPP